MNHEYRRWAILNTYYNACSLPLWPAALIGGFQCFTVVAIFGIVHFFGRMELTYYAMYPLILNNCIILVSLYLILASRVQGNSALYSRQLGCAAKIRRSFSRNNSRVSNIFPFGVQIGIVRRIRYTHLLDFYDMAVNMAISALVAFKTGG